MNASLKPKTLKINSWLRDSAEMIANVGITSALLDAEIILAHTLRKSRTWLHAHGEEELSSRELDIASARLELRLDRTPIAYIIGHKEFYSRLFKVTPSVLIPRPESEAIITQFLALPLPDKARVIDVGAGSGCLGITTKLERPDANVTLCDISRHALTVAESNSALLQADVSVVKSDLLTSAPGLYDVIIANLPYVDREWERSPETNHEPEMALFAKNHGLDLILTLLDQTRDHQQIGGYILLEADPEQHAAISKKSEAYGYAHVLTDGYCLVFKRVR